MKVCRRCLVSGTVQGVFFRASTCQKASEFNINGWVKNLPDDRVEVIACGDEKNVDQLINWLWSGPANARVSDVAVLQANAEEYADFKIRYD